jgi:hypothetical protein
MHKHPVNLLVSFSFLAFFIPAHALTAEFWTPIQPVYTNTPPGAVFGQVKRAVDRNTTLFQDNAGKDMLVRVIGVDFPYEAEETLDQVNSNAQMLSQTAWIIPKAEVPYTGSIQENPKPSQPAVRPTQPSAPEQNAASGSGGWLTRKSTNDVLSYGYVYSKDQTSRQYVAANFVAVAAGMAYMFKPGHWPGDAGNADTRMVQAMMMGVDDAVSKKTGLYAMLNNPKSVAYVDIAQLYNNLDKYYLPEDSIQEFKNMFQRLIDSGQMELDASGKAVIPPNTRYPAAVKTLLPGLLLGLPGRAGLVPEKFEPVIW